MFSYFTLLTLGLQTTKEIETGIQHIIADIISKDEELNAMMVNV